MRNSLLRKYLAGSSVIVIVSFLILGFILTIFLSRYLETEKKDLITSNAKNFSEYTSYSFNYNNSELEIDNSDFQNIINNTSETIDCDIFITDGFGYVILSGSYRSGNEYTRNSVPISVLEKVTNEGYYENGRLDGFFSDTHLTYCTPVYNKSNSTEIIAYAFTSVNTAQIRGTIYSIINIFIYSAAASFLIVFCVVFFVAERIVRPLREMAKVAKAFAMGDFSQKVAVKSNDETGQLANAFNELSDYISSSENMRKNFIANVSHELKTPMTTIGGFIDGILDGTIPESQQKKYLTIVSDEIKRLSRLVTSMLSLSRIDSGELQLKKQSFNLTDTIIQTLLTFETKINEKNIEIRGLDDMLKLQVEGDPDLIHQVVYNLFENAVKFTNEGGYIELLVTDTAASTSIEIVNSGEGIPEEDLKLIFDKFYKTDKSRNQDKIGMGLGLYIVKVILSLHEGGISVKSQLSQYTAFTFWLPKTPPKQQHLEIVAQINAQEEDDES